MLTDILTTVTQAGVLAFVVASMAAMGLTLTVDRIVDPLRDIRLMVLILAANFVAVPAAAIVVARVLPVGPATGTALVIYGCCAGAPFLPKLGQLARADVGLAVGMMVLLMVVTVGYAPLMLPLAVEGVSVDAWQIASSLILFMLVPLGIALLIRARCPDLAAEWADPASRISTTALLIGISAGLFVSWREIVAAVGSWPRAGEGEEARVTRGGCAPSCVRTTPPTRSGAARRAISSTGTRRSGGCSPTAGTTAGYPCGGSRPTAAHLAARSHRAHRTCDLAARLAGRHPE